MSITLKKLSRYLNFLKFINIEIRIMVGWKLARIENLRRKPYYFAMKNLEN